MENTCCLPRLSSRKPIQTLNRQNIVFGKITITLRYLKLTFFDNIDESKSKTVNIVDENNSIGFDSLYAAIESLNTFINNNEINYISYIDIILNES